MKNVEDIFALSPGQADLFGSLPDPSQLGGLTALLELDLAFPDDDPAADGWLDRWNAAWARVVERHAALRTLFVWDDPARPVQVVRRRVDAAWQLHDLRHVDPAEAERRLAELVEREERRPLDLSRAPLARGAVVVTAGGGARVLWSYHPLVLDRDSAARAISELLATHVGLGRGVGPELPATASLRDWVAWLGKLDGAEARSFWRRRTAGRAAPSLAPRAAAEPPAASRHRVVLPAALAGELAALASESGVSVVSVVAAAWLVLLERRGTARPLFGVEVAGRPDGPAASRALLGPFARTVPLLATVAPGATIPEALRALEEERTTAGRQAPLPLAEILAGRELSSAVAAPPPELEVPDGVRVRSARWRHPAAPVPLRLEAPGPRAVHLELTFDRRRLAAAEVAALGGELRALLASFLGGVASLAALRRGEEVAGGGERLDPSAVEALLARHRAVRAARVAAEPDGAGGERLRARVLPAASGDRERAVELSLFFFADADSGDGHDRYRLYLESARYADRHGFAAVWTPERHFHENGGLYPNPSVLSAALATTTERIGLRAGSVVLPLHHTLRVAEEWSIVDNLSGGRVGLSFASGWVPNDFAFFPERFADKREHMFRQIGELERLWRGEKLPARDGKGNDYEVGVFPRPVQPELPIWITCSGDPAVFERTGELRHNLLTALLTMPVEEAARKIALYRQRLREVSGGTERGHVTLMIHTFVGAEEAATRDLVRPALSEFLGSHLGLVKSAKKSLDSGVRPEVAANEEHLISFAFEKYYRAASLLGTQEKCAAMVERLRAIGVDELACLIDFGLDADTVLGGVERLKDLQEQFRGSPAASGGQASLPAELQSYLAARLPEAAVPVAIELIDELPEPVPRLAAGAAGRAVAATGGAGIEP